MITREEIRLLRRIEITTNRVVHETLAGRYHSVFKGRGIAFAEVRPYQPGDEIRFIDWNVTARTGHPFVKLFTEERELTVMLLVDRSASCGVGLSASTKAEVATRIGAMLAFSAVSNNDRVGLALFTDRIERFVPPRKGRKHVMRVLAEIKDYPARRTATDLGAALTFLHRSTRRRCIAFAVSDFLCDGWDRPLAVAAQRHDVVPIVLEEPLQGELPDVGLLHAFDPETGELVVVDTGSRRVRTEYKRITEAAVARRERIFQQLRVDAIRIRLKAWSELPEAERGLSETERARSDEFVKPLVSFFERRGRRIRA